MSLRAAAAHNVDENAPRGKVAVQAGASQAEGRRRALGDIANTAGVLTRSQAAMLKAGATKPQTSLRPRETNAGTATTRTRAASAKPVSLSGLLQQRSDAVSARPAPKAPSPLPDIDSGDKNDPLTAWDYVHNIHSYYKRVEPKYRVDSGYMTNQVEINEKMRAILVDWLVEVHLKFKLMPETLYLTCNLIDRYLAVKNVTRKRLQLVGVTAMLIASKYEEIWAPEVRDFVYISDKAYTREEILAMEKTMLCTLRFELTLPTIYNFSSRFRKAANVDKDTEIQRLVEYVSELSMLDMAMLKYPPSVIAAAAVHIALRSMGKRDLWPRTLAKHSGYSLEQIMPCVEGLVFLMTRAPTANLSAVYKKFCNQKYGEVAKRPVPDLNPSDSDDMEDEGSSL